MRRYLAPELECLGRASTGQTPVASVDPYKGAPQVYGKKNDSHSSSPTSIFGYQVLNQCTLKNGDCPPASEYTRSQMPPVERRYSSDHIVKDSLGNRPFPGLRDMERLFGGSVPITYSFHETIFSRRVQRYCLEHAYRLFIDSRSDPTVIYQIFRLVPCIREKMKMLPYFRKLVSAGIQDTLEILSLPFYCIGGAGTHYPRKDQCGNLTYPSNMRLPKRLLAVLPMTKTSHENKSLEDPQSHLKLFGLDGEWFDCQDVQGYLEEKGVILNRSSLFAEIHMPPLHQSTFAGEDSIPGDPEISFQPPRVVNNSSINRGYGPCGETQRGTGPQYFSLVPRLK